MARPVDWSPEATADLGKICEYIGRDSPRYAGMFARRVIAAVERLTQFPRLGRIVPEYGRDHLREIIYQRYRIVYRLKRDGIEVATVCHGAKLLRSDL